MQISRRHFLKLGFGVLGGAILAACAPKPTPTPTPAPKAEATKAPEPTKATEATKAPEPTKAPTAVPAPKELPKVHLWSNMIALTKPGGSDPEKLEAVKKYIMEQVGVEPIAYVPPAGTAAAEKLNLMLASKSEELDIFQTNWGAYKDALTPLNELLEQYGQNVLKAHTKARWDGVTDRDGKIWGVPRLGLMAHTGFTWFRTDWLKELGLAMPATWDEMEKAIEAFKKRDPAAVVITDALDSMRMCLVGGFTEFGYAKWFDKADKKIKPPELQPGFKDWLAKMNEWWNKGWLHKETLATIDLDEAFKSGKVGVHAGWYSCITISAQNLILQNAVPGMQFGFPEKITGPKGLCMTNNASPSSVIAITKKAKHPDACMKLINWEYDPGKDNVCTAVYGLKGVDWVWADENNKYYLRRLTQAEKGDKVYAGEFMCATGLGTDTWYAPDDDAWRRHYEHIRDYVSKYDNGKVPVDFDVVYDGGLIRTKVPGLEDINRLISEETVKFITGVRPISEYDAWTDQLYKAGLNDWIEAYTEQYLAKHPA